MVEFKLPEFSKHGITNLSDMAHERWMRAESNEGTYSAVTSYRKNYFQKYKKHPQDLIYDYGAVATLQGFRGSGLSTKEIDSVMKLYRAQSLDFDNLIPTKSRCATTIGIQTYYGYPSLDVIGMEAGASLDKLLHNQGDKNALKVAIGFTAWQLSECMVQSIIGNSMPHLNIEDS